MCVQVHVCVFLGGQVKAMSGPEARQLFKQAAMMSRLRGILGKEGAHFDARFYSSP